MTFTFPLLNSDTESNPELNPEQRAYLDERIAQLVQLGLEKGVSPGDSIGLSQSYFDGLAEIAARCYRQKNYSAALPMYSKLIQMKPYEAAYYKGLGACFLGMENYLSAISAYQCGRMFDALDADLHYYLGLAFYFNKDFDQAFEWLRFARVLDEKDPQSQGKIAAFATQLLERLRPLVSPELARNMDLRPD